MNKAAPQAMKFTFGDVIPIAAQMKHTSASTNRTKTNVALVIMLWLRYVFRINVHTQLRIQTLDRI